MSGNPIPAVPLNADTLLINNEIVPAASAGDDNSDITSLSSVKESSAKAIASAINKITSKTDVTATSQNSVIGSNFIPYQKLTGDLFVNGKTINLDSLTSSTANIGPISNSSAFAGSLFINGYAYSLEPLATSTSKSIDFVNLINAQTATTNIMATADTAGNFTIVNISGGDVYFSCMESNYNPDGSIHPSMTTSDMITALSLPADTLGYSNPTQFANSYDPRHKITAAINTAIGDANFARYDHYNLGTGISFYSDGSNIELGLKTSANPALILSCLGINLANIFVSPTATTSDATTNYGTVTLDSDRAIKISNGTSATASSDLTLLGIRTGIYFGDFLFGNNSTPTEMPNSGFFTDIYNANETFVSSTPRLPIISGQLPSREKPGDFIINGVNVPPPDELDDKVSASIQSDGSTALSSIRYLSSISVAAAINKISDTTKVTAKIYPNKVISHEQFSGTTPISLVKLYLNGTKIDFNNVSNNVHTRQDIADCINLHKNETGVFAEDNGIALTLTAVDGRNIEMAAVATEQQNPSLIPNALGIPWAAVSINPNSNINLKTTTYSPITLISDQAIKISSNSPNGLNLLNELGFKEGIYGGSNNGKKISNCDLTNISDDVLTSIDVAIGQISNMRSTLGALQNKLIFAIDNLTSGQNNVMQSSSRLIDSDYSYETTQLARFQIITQSSLSLLAQANQQPQLVLQLLKDSI